MGKISAVIITCNEERNIGRCISSLKGITDEVIVVDSGSTDATLSIAESMGALVSTHEWAGYSLQKNYAETLASGEWILSIDADEALSDSLRRNLSELKNGGLDDGKVYSLRRLNKFCGTWIHHCGWYPDEKVRLWRKGYCKWNGTVHEEITFTKSLERCRIDGDLLHYTCDDLDAFVSRQARYGILAAEKSYNLGRRCGTAALLLKPAWNFFCHYILKGGFLDGSAGFMVCRISSFYALMKYYHLYELCNSKQAEK